MTRPEPARAGETYRAAARRGTYRYVRISRIRGNAGYAIVREVLPNGRPARGWLHGVDRSLPFHVPLELERGVLVMPARYERVELHRKPSRTPAAECAEAAS